MRSRLLGSVFGVWSAVLVPNLVLAQVADPALKASSPELPTVGEATVSPEPVATTSVAPEVGSAPAPASSAADAPTTETSVPTPNSPPAAVSVAGSADAGTASEQSAPAPKVDETLAVNEGSDGASAPGDDEPSSKKAPEVEVGLRVIGGFRYRKDELDDEANYGFHARQVRASLKLKLGKRLFTRLSAEFTDGIGSGSGVRFLRTAVLEYRQSKALRLTFGRYKRPFSYLQLQSAAELPVLDRGLMNNVLVEESAWGDRGIGAMASGKVKALKLGWAFSLSNPSPDTLSTAGLDTILRLTWSPSDMFTFGVNGGNKYLDFDQRRKHFQAIGGDISFNLGGLAWQLEGAVADLPWRDSVGFGATSLLSYTHRITKHLQLQPVVFAEYADANSEYGRNESVRLQGGINAIIREQLRIMPQYKVTTPVGEPLLSAPTSSPQFAAINPWDQGYELSLIVSLVL